MDHKAGCMILGRVYIVLVKIFLTLCFTGAQTFVTRYCPIVPEVRSPTLPLGSNIYNSSLHS